MSSDLKPCPNPWCASHRKWDVEIFEAHRPILIPSRGSCEWAVSCPVCPLQSPWSDTEAEAIAAWNARPDELERLSTPTDVADRREAIVRQVLDLICAAMCKTAGAVSLDPDPWVRELASQIASLIAGPPEGFVVVPAEPTEAMLAAWATSDKYKDDWRRDCAVGWSAMIAARPTGES